MIKVKITKYADVDWQSMNFIQTDQFKTISDESREKLRKSILNNEIVDVFKVWEDRQGRVWCLDGFHRVLVMKSLLKEGIGIPKMLPAQFIECKNKREAAKLVLIYSSQYAEVSQTGLQSFISDFNIDMESFKIEIDIPQFNLTLPETQGSYPHEDTETIDMEARHECPKCHYKW